MNRALTLIAFLTGFVLAGATAALAQDKGAVEAQALDALRRANQAIPANRDLLLAYADALADGIKSDALPDDFVGVMRQVNAIDPDQVDALWYLGLAAAQHGDTHRAVAFWRRLAADLPAGSKDRKTVQERLDALP